MAEVLEILSKVGIFIILGAKSCFYHILDCLSSCIGIFTKVKKIKNPNENFKDFHQFVRLVTDDIEDEEEEPG